jgi:hypothetical protein
MSTRQSNAWQKSHLWKRNLQLPTISISTFFLALGYWNEISEFVNLPTKAHHGLGAKTVNVGVCRYLVGVPKKEYYSFLWKVACGVQSMESLYYKERFVLWIHSCLAMTLDAMNQTNYS